MAPVFLVRTLSRGLWGVRVVRPMRGCGPGPPESIELTVASVARCNVIGKRWLWVSTARHNTNTDKVLVSAVVALLSPCLNR